MACAVAAAPPDSSSLDAAREEARAVLADGFRDLNVGRVTLIELADRVADMAAGSNSPAMTRVLQEGAFNMYRKAGGLKRAAEKHAPFWINLGISRFVDVELREELGIETTAEVEKAEARTAFLLPLGRNGRWLCGGFFRKIPLQGFPFRPLRLIALPLKSI